MKFNRSFVNVIGCGFAGSECALTLAEHGVKVHVFDHQTNENNKEISADLLKKPLAKELLREELIALDSQLLNLEKSFLNNSVKLDSFSLLEEAKKKVKSHKNIQYFDISVKEINFDELTVISTGAQTDHKLFEYLVEVFGARKCFDCFPIFPLVKGVDQTKFCKKGENLFLPLSYQEYLSLINLIVSKLNTELLSQGKKVQSGTIESLVLKEKDALKNEYLSPIYLDDCISKPYAVVKLEKKGYYYEINGFCSDLSNKAQVEIIRSLKGLENSTLVRKGESVKYCYINAPYMINEFCQSKKFENLFFAGNIAGVFGKTESIACGLYVAYNILRLKQDKNFIELPKGTIIGSMMQKIIKTNNFNYSKFNPIFADYDIITSDDSNNAVKEKESFLRFRSKMLMNKYKEELKNGKHV